MKGGLLLRGGFLRVGCVGVVAALGLCGGCRSARVETPRGLTGEGASEAARIYIPDGAERRYRVVGSEDIEYRRSDAVNTSGEWLVLIHERDNEIAKSPIRIVKLRRGDDGVVSLVSIMQSSGPITTFYPPIAVMPAGGVAALDMGEVFVAEAKVESAGEDGLRSGTATHETELMGFDDRGRAIVRQRLFMDLGMVTVERALMITADAEGIVREAQARTVKFGVLVVDREKREVERKEE